MRILQINKNYHLGSKSGGAGTYFLNLIEILEKHGNQVIPFAQKEKETIPTPYSKYFVSEMDLSEAKFSGSSFRKIKRIISNKEAAQKLDKLLEENKVDIAHIHNIYHQISPSILPVLKKHGIPIVMTVHDYKLICPNYELFTEGAVCERCRDHKYINALTHKCLKNSRGASFVAMVEAYIHHWQKIYIKNIDLFITPSKFVKDELIKFGLPAEKIKQIYNPLNTSDFTPQYEVGNYFLAWGRLSEVKGFDVLIKAYKKLDTETKLLIIGDGPVRKNLEQLAESDKRIEFRGFKTGQELKDIIKNAIAVIVPSIWYEVLGLVSLEAMASGKPVIASDIGGLAETVQDEVTGWKFNAGDVKDLQSKLELALSQKDKLSQMGQAARKSIEENFDPERHYQQIISVYQSLLQKQSQNQS